jgi:hypothetical protein
MHSSSQKARYKVGCHKYYYMKEKPFSIVGLERHALFLKLAIIFVMKIQLQGL